MLKISSESKVPLLLSGAKALLNAIRARFPPLFNEDIHCGEIWDQFVHAPDHWSNLGRFLGSRTVGHSYFQVSNDEYSPCRQICRC